MTTPNQQRRRQRMLILTWTAIIEVSLGSTIFSWTQFASTRPNTGSGLVVLIIVLVAPMAVAAVPSLHRQFWLSRAARIVIGICLAVTGAGPATLALADFLAPQPTGFYVILGEATAGIWVLAISVIRQRRVDVCRSGAPVPPTSVGSAAESPANQDAPGSELSPPINPMPCERSPQQISPLSSRYW